MYLKKNESSNDFPLTIRKLTIISFIRQKQDYYKHVLFTLHLPGYRCYTSMPFRIKARQIKSNVGLIKLMSEDVKRFLHEHLKLLQFI